MLIWSISIMWFVFRAVFEQFEFIRRKYAISFTNLDFRNFCTCLKHLSGSTVIINTDIIANAISLCLCSSMRQWSHVIIKQTSHHDCSASKCFFSYEVKSWITIYFPLYTVVNKTKFPYDIGNKIHNDRAL